MTVKGKYTVVGTAPGIEVRLVKVAPGDVRVVVVIDSEHRTNIPLDNLTKAAVRLDPEHASFAERQIQKLRRELADARAQVFDMKALREENRTLRIARDLDEKDRG